MCIRDRYVSNIVINQGADFDQVFTISDNANLTLDLSLYTISAQLRKHPGSTTKVDFSTSKLTPTTDGSFELKLTDTQTSALKSGRYVYDVMITEISNDKKTRVIEGTALVREGVTR